MRRTVVSSDAVNTAEREHDAASDGATQLERPGALLLVADGMGGAKAGEVASGMAVQIVREEMQRRANGGSVAEADDAALAEIFSAAVERANELIREEGASNPSRQGMGTTLTAVWADWLLTALLAVTSAM